jgi:hypothetical protein
LVEQTALGEIRGSVINIGQVPQCDCYWRVLKQALLLPGYIWLTEINREIIIPGGNTDGPEQGMNFKRHVFPTIVVLKGQI